jgi:hypothetical protein
MRLGLRGSSTDVTIAVIVIPSVDSILVPVVDLLLQGRSPLVDGRRAHDSLFVPLVRRHSLPQLKIILVFTGNSVISPASPPPLQHAIMVPAAETQATQTADNIGDDVVRVELAAVGKEALEEFGADAEEEGTHYESEVEGAPPVRIDNPVEYNGEDEKRQDMKGLVVYVETKLEGREASVTCQQAEDKEGA